MRPWRKLSKCPNLYKKIHDRLNRGIILNWVHLAENACSRASRGRPNARSYACARTSRRRDSRIACSDRRLRERSKNVAMLLREFPGVVPEACFDVSCSLSSTTTMFVAGAGARSDGADVDEGGGVDIDRDLILARELRKVQISSRQRLSSRGC